VLVHERGATVVDAVAAMPLRRSPEP
jgi:hypothetical protein